MCRTLGYIKSKTVALSLGSSQPKGFLNRDICAYPTNRLTCLSPHSPKSLRGRDSVSFVLC